MSMSPDRFVPLAEVLDMIKAESESRELNTDQKIALDHSQKLVRLSTAKARELQEALSRLDFVSDAMACKIVDITPSHPDDIRVLFAKERLILEKDHIDQILEVIQEHQ
ncbi:MAG: RNA polymerase [Methanomassiliicoccales archaeon]|nr:RNA polymerase [Methanomassiliicoccales archaeon]NYT14401.1 RNA polymerase [Methanomassiliicoccales archaeon]